MSDEYASRYPVEHLDSEWEDDGTMPENVEELRQAVVGHKIVRAERLNEETLALILDTGKMVTLRDYDDCCAYTDLEAFLIHPDKVDHVITGVGTTEGYSKWHIYADMGDVLELTVGWSCGNPFYYGYGFTITVQDEEFEATL